MANPFFTGILTGFVPAMALLYVMLHRYEGFFDERKVFRSLLFGMLAGALVTFGEFFMRPVQLGAFATAAFIVVGFALLEAAVKTAALNRAAYRMRKDTPYYGASFGLGFGAVNALLLAAVADSVRQSAGDAASFAFYAVVLQYSLGAILIHGATSIVIGDAVANGVAFHGLARAALLQAPFNLALALAFLVPALQAAPWSFFLPTGGLLYALFAALSARGRILDNIVPDELAQRVRREMRRQLHGPREGGGAGGAGGPDQPKSP